MMPTGRGKITFILALAAIAFLAVVPARTARAACGLCVPGYMDIQTAAQTAFDMLQQTVEQTLDQQLQFTEQWVETDVWDNNILPALNEFADQISGVAMQQTMAIGMFIDAKHQMETQRVFQTIRLRAHKDYQPSAGMCEFGSSVKSLAASERRAEVAAHVLSQRSQDRNLRSANTSSGASADGDQVNRLNQWKSQFCDPSNNGGGLSEACRNGNNVGATNPARMNIDIDYTAQVETPWTLNADFTDNATSDAESNLYALANNLYGYEVMKNVTQFNQQDTATSGELNTVQSKYLDARALVAKRSVAENSFNAITSMKTAGTAGSRDFLRAIVADLGVPAGDLDRYLSAANSATGPSYYAQMEVLTKKIYQNPDFYTNLYDKPANVERKEVAMQAIGLMQKFDLYKSYLRTEASLSVLLETAVADLQKQVADEFANQGK